MADLGEVLSVLLMRRYDATGKSSTETFATKRKPTKQKPSGSISGKLRNLQMLLKVRLLT